MASGLSYLLLSSVLSSQTHLDSFLMKSQSYQHLCLRRLRYVKRPGTVLANGSHIANLDLDDPSRVQKVGVYPDSAVPVNIPANVPNDYHIYGSSVISPAICEVTGSYIIGCTPDVHRFSCTATASRSRGVPVYSATNCTKSSPVRNASYRTSSMATSYHHRTLRPVSPTQS